jgi:hypothetical protein
MGILMEEVIIKVKLIKDYIDDTAMSYRAEGPSSDEEFREAVETAVIDSLVAHWQHLYNEDEECEAPYVTGVCKFMAEREGIGDSHEHVKIFSVSTV